MTLPQALGTEDLPFGRLLTAMVTPFDEAGAVDHGAAAKLAAHLVDEQHNDGLVINGTTGESPTTTDDEKAALVRTVVDAVGDRANVVAGVGTFSTAHTIDLAAQAAEAGADGLLVVTPYYSKPPQSGLLMHFTEVAERTELPIILYDIPHRSGVPIAEDTLVELAAHERIVAVKDAKGDLISSGRVMARTAEAGHRLAYYSGEDALTLSLLAVGGVGLIGTSTHFTGALAAEMMSAFAAGDHGRALDIHRRLLPVLTGVFAAQGCILVKAGLALQGRPVGGLRLPLVPATDAERDAFAAALTAAGLL